MKKYSIKEFPEKERPVVEIIEDCRYKDMQLYYGKVSFNEENGFLKMSFDVDIINNPNNIPENDKGLKQYMGDLLTELIQTEIEICDMIKDRLGRLNILESQN